MRNILNIAIHSPLTVSGCADIIDMPAINYVTFDITKIVDEHDAITRQVDLCRNQLGFEGLIILADWLYGWYKKIDEFILSNRILNTFDYVLHTANNLRATKKLHEL